MSDIKKKKYKGFICSEPSRHQGPKKKTKEWCKGKSGLEHDWKWMESDGRSVWGLPYEIYKKCARCGKTPYDQRSVYYGFGEVLKAARISMGVTQQKLAANLGVPQPLVSSVESDEHSPSLRTMERYCEALGIELEVQVRPRERYRYQGLTLKSKTP